MCKDKDTTPETDVGIDRRLARVYTASLAQGERSGMDCPRCDVELTVEKHKGLEVDRCSQCEGIWLEHHELGKLEDTVADDVPKGSLMTWSHGSDLLCPHCKDHMKWFRYRYYEVEMDYCEQEHGFWLDKGEDKHVLEVMEKRNKDLKRSATAEQNWEKFLSGVNSKSFVDKVKNMFRK